MPQLVIEVMGSQFFFHHVSPGALNLNHPAWTRAPLLAKLFHQAHIIIIVSSVFLNVEYA